MGAVKPPIENPNYAPPLTGVAPTPGFADVHDILKSPMAIAIERAAYQAIGSAVGVAATTFTATGGDVKATMAAFLGALAAVFLGRGIVEGHIDSHKATLK